MTSADRRPRRALGLVTVVAVVAGCSGAGDESTEQYCTSVLTVRTATTAGALLARAREITEVVPDEIEADWVVLTDLFAKVAQANPNDATATADAYRAALHPDVQKAAESVRSYTQITCGVSLDEAGSPLLPVAPSSAP